MRGVGSPWRRGSSGCPRRAIWVGLVGLALSGCGPQPEDLVGAYGFQLEESVTACTGGDPYETGMTETLSGEISLGGTLDIVFEFGPCVLEASVSEWTFTVPTQHCVLDDLSPSIDLTLSGRGEVLDGVLSFDLKGKYVSDIFGAPLNCEYQLKTR